MVAPTEGPCMAWGAQRCKGWSRAAVLRTRGCPGFRMGLICRAPTRWCVQATASRATSTPRWCAPLRSCLRQPQSLHKGACAARSLSGACPARGPAGLLQWRPQDGRHAGPAARGVPDPRAAHVDDRARGADVQRRAAHRHRCGPHDQGGLRGRGGGLHVVHSVTCPACDDPSMTCTLCIGTDVDHATRVAFVHEVGLACHAQRDLPHMMCTCCAQRMPCTLQHRPSLGLRLIQPGSCFAVRTFCLARLQPCHCHMAPAAGRNLS